MLILTRRVDEKIKIGDNVVVTILGVEGGNVKIGIDAPREITILRMEVLEQIGKENVDSLAKDVTDIVQVAALIKNKFSKEQEG